MNQNNKLSNKLKSPLLCVVKPRLIIGLGNPGEKYETTYHNVGFLFIDYLNEFLSKSTIADCRLIKSDSYMNQSGNFIKTSLKKHKTKPEKLMIVHDDSDIELGKYKISFGCGSAGHNGVQSIIDTLKTKNFWRLRMGIGQKTKNKQQTTRIKAENLVLKKIGERDLKILKETFQSAFAAFEKKQWKD